MGHSYLTAIKHYLATRAASMFAAVAETDVGGMLDVDVPPRAGAGGDDGG